MNESLVPVPGVLIVDDNRLVRSLMREILESDGIDVRAEAESAQEARECLAGGNIDVVIMDISLKDGVGGLALLKQVRQEGVKVPFIMVSAHEEALYARTSLDANAQGYICKSKLVPCLAVAVREVHSGGIFTSNIHMGKPERES